MAYFSLVDQSHEVLAKAIKPGDIAIDATVGNGHDTLFLARAVGNSGQVLGFDIQQSAIDNTMKLLQQHGMAHRCTLIRQSHAGLAGHICGNLQHRIKATVFNLGYLPGSDKSVITHSKDTLAALNAVLPHLVSGGVITIVAYSGHPGGELETTAVIGWSSQLDIDCYTVEVIKPGNTVGKTPILIVIKRK